MSNPLGQWSSAGSGHMDFVIDGMPLSDYGYNREEREMSSAIQRSGAQTMSIVDAAKAAEEAGMLPGNMKWQGAAWIMQTGAEYGFGPARSMQLFYVVNNKVCLTADGTVALVMQAHPDWRFNYEADATKAKVTVTNADGEVLSVGEFTIEDATRAGLLNKGGPWKQYPRQMLIARAKVYAARLAAPDAVGGLYSPEEMGADTDKEGKPNPRVTSFEPDPKPAPAVAKRKTHWEGVGMSVADNAEPDRFVEVYSDTGKPVDPNEDLGPDPEDDLGPGGGTVKQADITEYLTHDAVLLLSQAIKAAGLTGAQFKAWAASNGVDVARIPKNVAPVILCWVIENTTGDGTIEDAVALHVQWTGQQPVLDVGWEPPADEE